MRRRWGILLVSILILQSVLTGCEEKSRYKTALLSDPGPAQETGQTVTKPQQKAPAEEKVILINDTVADVFRQPDIQSERVTQAIFNQPVSVLEEKESWTKVKVVDGYTGWVKSKLLSREHVKRTSDYKFKLVVTGKSKKIFSQPKGGLTEKEVIMGTELYCTDKYEEWYKVELPGGGSGWLERDSTIQIPLGSQIPKTTAADFITTARKFLGTTYLWGGVSSWGIDCSGFTYICSRVNGVDLQRDADQQANSGEKILIENAKPGDLLFFSTHTDLKDISHVGIFLGNGQFIHASKSRGMVVIGSLKEDYFARRLVAVRRYF